MASSLSKSRIITLVDMDCFYCQVEEKFDPSLKGVPAAVVQYKAFKGGAIIAVNYEARAHGVGRHMRGDDAKAACPEIVLVRVPEMNGKADLTKYRDAGKQVLDVICEFSPNVERASVDEAYIDLTEAVNNFLASHTKNGEEPVSCLSKIDRSFLAANFPMGFENSDAWLDSLSSSEMVPIDDIKLALGAEIVGRMRQAVYEKTGYRCSAGIAHNKVLAKLGAGLNKPNKQTVISQESVPALYAQTKLTKVRMLGGQFGELLVEKLKCEFMGDLIKFSLKQLKQYFGDERGDWLYNLARGHDNEPVTKRQLPQSIGCSKNFFGREALTTKEQANFWINRLSTEVVERIQRDWEMNNRRAKLITLHVKFHEQKAISRSCGKNVPYNAERMSNSVMVTLEKLYQQFGVIPINQLGLIASKLEEEVSNNTKIDSFYRVKAPPIATTTTTSTSVSSENVEKIKVYDEITLEDDDDVNLLKDKEKIIAANEEPDFVEQKDEQDEVSDIELLEEVSPVKLNGELNESEKESKSIVSEESTPRKVELNNFQSDGKSLEKRKPFFVCTTSPPKIRKFALPLQNDQPVDTSTTTIVPAAAKSVFKVSSVTKNSVTNNNNYYINNKSVTANPPDANDDAVPCCSKSLLPETTTAADGSEKPMEKISSENEDSRDADTRNLSKEYLQTCERCNKPIPLWEYLSHLDFHVAMDLQDTFNKDSAETIHHNNNNETRANLNEKNNQNSATVVAGTKRTTAGGKNRGGAGSKRGKLTKPVTTTKAPPQMKTLDTYFLPKN